MNIVLVTDKPRANAVEFFCVANGGRIVALVNLTDSPYENQHITSYTISDIPRIGHDAVIIDCIDAPFVISQVKKYKTAEIYNYWPDRNKLLDLLRSSTLLCKRKFGVKDDCLQVGTEFYNCDQKVTEDMPSINSIERQAIIIDEVYEAYNKAYLKYPDLDEKYQTGENWRHFMEGSRPNFYSAIQRVDKKSLSDLLQNFFRNELTGGTFGGKEGYDDFCSRNFEPRELRSYFNVWKHCVPDTPIQELDNPRVGNPYGLSVNGALINSNSFCNHYRSVFLSRLISNIDKPVIAELGAGFGGLAYYLSKDNSDLTYINFDLPENLMVSSYYLKSIFPDKKIKLYDGLSEPLSREELQEYDLVLLPHFCLPRLTNLSIDLFVNTISLSEMDFLNIETYFKEIHRVTRQYFYHENMLDNGAGYKYFPTSVFPELADYKLLMNAPSRWPAFSLSSPGHCHMEFLYERNNGPVTTNRTNGDNL